MRRTVLLSVFFLFFVAADAGHSGRLPTETLRGVGVPDRQGEGPEAGAVEGLREARRPAGIRGCVALQAECCFRGEPFLTPWYIYIAF